MCGFDRSNLLFAMTYSPFACFNHTNPSYNLWSPWPELNWRPLPYQGSALPLSYMGKNKQPFKPLTPQLTPGAGEGNRTLVVSLEGFCSTIELHPRYLRVKR